MSDGAGALAPAPSPSPRTPWRRWPGRPRSNPPQPSNHLRRLYACRGCSGRTAGLREGALTGTSRRKKDVSPPFDRRSIWGEYRPQAGEGGAVVLRHDAGAVPDCHSSPSVRSLRDRPPPPTSLRSWGRRHRSAFLPAYDARQVEAGSVGSQLNRVTQVRRVGVEPCQGPARAGQPAPCGDGCPCGCGCSCALCPTTWYVGWELNPVKVRRELGNRRPAAMVVHVGVDVAARCVPLLGTSGGS